MESSEDGLYTTQRQSASDPNPSDGCHECPRGDHKPITYKLPSVTSVRVPTPNNAWDDLEGTPESVHSFATWTLPGE